MKFNVGDRVKRIRGYHMGMSVGDIATVIGMGIRLKEYGGAHSPSSLELVEINDWKAELEGK